MTPEHKAAITAARESGVEMFRAASVLIDQDTPRIIAAGIELHPSRTLGGVMNRTAFIYCQQVNRARYIRNLEPLAYALWNEPSTVYPFFDAFDELPVTARDLFDSDEAAWNKARGTRPDTWESIKPWDRMAYEFQETRVRRAIGLPSLEL